MVKALSSDVTSVEIDAFERIVGFMIVGVTESDEALP